MSEGREQDWPVRAPILVGLLALAVLVAGLVLWGTGARISGAVVAGGQVEVQQQRQIVQHPDGGVVARIAVSEGMTVAAGDLLIALDGTLLQSELAIVEGQYFEILARRGRLEAERDEAEAPDFPDELIQGAQAQPALASLIEGQMRLFRSRRETLRQSLGQLAAQSEQIGSEIAGIDAQMQALSAQGALIAQELRDQRNLLDRGLAQASRVLALEREAARLEGELGALQAQRAAAQIRRTEIGIQRLRLGAARREQAETELRDLGYRELELAERRRALAERIARLEIRAPVAGVVHNMQVTTPRSVVRGAETLLYLVPQDRPLQIGARIATNNVDELQIGQAVSLRFSSLSARITPEITGRLERVSADALTDPATGAPYYRVEIAIPPDALALLEGVVLLPGMPVEIYIRTSERSPLAYLMKPLTVYFNRAFREG
ncbi:HlyD family type I secretion periplasmic adaptor subunit [Paracoccus bogoriensis]|uniref:HlyD family type I secretion periplasmic adaptor subunit n=1 Tax=Paracoccus bogoriensis TaxID=242065 RepID=UPI001CA5EED2|nr:HlyD family type I secretion periplasmic adaptor subunit [Paracoccus bogoriensis]MBW7055509.1 HlyD family type I secretion periplasmic adaptor subunit [Paracoccus bogoriensis]